MANPNKAKGDRAERAVRDWASERWPGSFKTRAGFDDDLGDIVATPSAGRLVLQVKDVAKPTWTAWFSQLAGQVDTCRSASKPIRVIGGAIVHKVRGSANPAAWRAVMTVEDLADLVERTYAAGWADGQAGRTR